MIRKCRLPFSTLIRKLGASGKLLPLIRSTEAGTQISLNELQPENANGAITLSLEPGSNVIDSSKERREWKLPGSERSTKQAEPRYSTDGGMQIDLTERYRLNTPVSSRRICEPGSNLTTSTCLAFASEGGVRTVRDAGMTSVIGLTSLGSGFAPGTENMGIGGTRPFTSIAIQSPNVRLLKMLSPRDSRAETGIFVHRQTLLLVGLS
jgi:hypothetical protein